MRTVGLFAVAASLFIASSLTALPPGSPATRQSPVPVCSEDSVAIGAPGADYVGGEGWTSMVCIAIDDLS